MSQELNLSDTHTSPKGATFDFTSSAEHTDVPTITTAIPTTPPATTSPTTEKPTEKPVNGLSESEQAKVKEILEFKSKIDILIGNVRDTKRLCEKYDNENQYLQDYIGTLMKSGEIKK